MKLAAIDIGTNSTRLLIAEYLGGNYKVLERDMITTRLGEGVDKNSFLSEKAITRTINAVKKFANNIKKHNIKKVKLVGTSALRDVNNNNKFSDILEEKTGYKLNIITGKKEAELIYKGVSTDLEEKNYRIVDIGGGSTEFIWSNENTIEMKSYDIGAVRLTERFISDIQKPLSKKEYNNIKQEVEKTITRLSKKEIADKTVIGVGGTITTLGAMDLGMTEYKSNKLHKHKLYHDSINQTLEQITGLSLNQRKDLTGLKPERADIITAGNIILNTIIEYYSYEFIMISERDILFGMIKELQ